MPKQLTVHNATVTTAAVEVKTLTISGKQVTLAVFRQLREEPLIADDGTLNGVPWGYVNYHPDKCDSDGHWHVVWQRGEDLLRARVAKTAGFDSKGSSDHLLFPPEARRYLASQVREWMHDRIDRCPVDLDTDNGGRFGRWAGEQLMGIPYGFPVWAQVDKSLAEALKAKEGADAALQNIASREADPGAFGGTVTPERTAWRNQQSQETIERFAVVRDALDAEVNRFGLSHGQLAEAMNAAAHIEHLRRQCHRDARAAIAELPHLFIAV